MGRKVNILIAEQGLNETNVKVASDDEFMRGGSGERKEEKEVIKKTDDFDLESGNDKGGQKML